MACIYLVNHLLLLAKEYKSSATLINTPETPVTFTQITVLQETISYTLGRFLASFDHLDEDSIHEMTMEGLLEYIERQRLTYMPHRGSRWDKVLKWAEFFALQISGYAKAIELFVPDSHMAAQLIWSASLSLLEVSLLRNFTYK